MTWYRHWLELRGRLPFFILIAVTLGVWPRTLFDGENAVFVRLFSMPSSDVESLALALSRTLFVVWGAAVALSGNGLRTWYMDRMAPSDMELPFTLTLPLSRARLVWTRLVAGWLVAVLWAVLVMGSQYAVHTYDDRTLPVAPMAAAVGWLAVAMAAWIVVLGAALMVRGAWLLPSLVAAIFVCLPLSLELMMGGLTGNVRAAAASGASLAGLAALAGIFIMRQTRRLEC